MASVDLILRNVLLSYIMLIGMIGLVAGLQNACNPRLKSLHAAENRVLRNNAYQRKTVTSLLICGRDCSMDVNCKSINFYVCTNVCELNNGTRLDNPGDFFEDAGQIYFDANEDTPLYVARTSCKTLLDAGFNSSGVYTIHPRGLLCNGLEVYCDMETDGGGWIVFQRRLDGTVDFNQLWRGYKTGFGNLSGEFWLGNDNLATLTSGESHCTWELLVDLEDWEGSKAWAKYGTFRISTDMYILHIGQYDSISTAGDSLMAHHNGRNFSTPDKDNDQADLRNCAKLRNGAWWFNACDTSHLNGEYIYDLLDMLDESGLVWNSWRGNHYSLKESGMKMRESCMYAYANNI